MDRHAALIAAAALGWLGAAPVMAAPARKKASPPRALHVVALDLLKRQVQIELTGWAHRPPAPNLYVFTDERDRHYIAQSAVCAEPTEAGVRACVLEIPAGYERHQLVSLEVHAGGLHSRLITAAAAEVTRAWEVALAAPSVTAPAAPPAMNGGLRPSPSPSPGPRRTDR